MCEEAYSSGRVETREGPAACRDSSSVCVWVSLRAR